MTENLKEALQCNFPEQDPKEIEKEISDSINEILAEGGSYDEVEEMMSEYGLEMDYVMDFI